MEKIFFTVFVKKLLETINIFKKLSKCFLKQFLNSEIYIFLLTNHIKQILINDPRPDPKPSFMNCHMLCCISWICFSCRQAWSNTHRIRIGPLSFRPKDISFPFLLLARDVSLEPQSQYCRRYGDVAYALSTVYFRTIQNLLSTEK